MTTAQEFADVRVAALMEEVSSQRNNALNEVANLKAELAVVTHALSKALASSKEVSLAKASLELELTQTREQLEGTKQLLEGMQPI